VTNILGWRVDLDDPLARRLLDFLDGTRDRTALMRDVRADASAMAALRSSAGGNTDGTGLAEALERGLEGLGRCALLLAD
jgi:hypothetical protein